MERGYSFNCRRFYTEWFGWKAVRKKRESEDISGSQNKRYVLLPSSTKREKTYKHIILHVSTNDAIDKSSIELTDELMQLKEFVELSLPGSIVILSLPTIRLDNNRANYNLADLRKNLATLNISAIQNKNITEEHLGKSGLHLNARGCGRLAMNYISCIRHL